MRKAGERFSYLWPGLPQLWADGAPWGLAVAVAFGLWLNLLLAASLVWSEWWTRSELTAGWALAGGMALVASAISSRRARRREAVAKSPIGEDLFQLAVSEYLKGHWFEVESTLSRLLSANAADVEARLLSVTLLRRTRRPAEAKIQLRLLERLDGAARWQQEIAQEQQYLGEDQLGAGEWLQISQSMAASAAEPVERARAA